MGFVAGRLKIVLATCHQPLETVCETLSIDACMTALGSEFSLLVNLASPLHGSACGDQPTCGEEACLETKNIASSSRPSNWLRTNGAVTATQITGPWPGDTV